MGKERRKHERIDLVAQAEVSSSDVRHLLRVTNASRGGLFLKATPDNYPDFQVDTELSLHLLVSVEVDEEVPDVTGKARIVRIASEESPAGFALEFVDLNKEEADKLDRLLELCV